MKKSIGIGIITLSFCLHAEVLDAVAVVVNGEPITTAEIGALERAKKIDKNKAIDLLIEDRLRHSLLKSIPVTEEEVDQKIEKIAARNSVDTRQMQKILLQRGITWRDYRAQIKRALQKQKLFKEKIGQHIRRPSPDELKLYFASHAKAFADDAGNIPAFDEVKEEVLKVWQNAERERAFKEYLKKARNNAHIKTIAH